jgi:Uma2 family endonuclease
MSVRPLISDVIYPESDGQPMGETELHVIWKLRVRELLKRHFRGQQVYVGADLLVYYREGDPKSVVVPDNFVTLGVDPGLRRIYQTWKEGRVPDWVLEITSSTTRKVDQQDKNRLYAQLGIAEYFLFDPLGDELQPALQGYRRSRGVYQPIVPETDGSLAACSIGIKLQLSGTDLVLRDLATGDVLLTEAEAERLHAAAAREAAEDGAVGS